MNFKTSLQFSALICLSSCAYLHVKNETPADQKVLTASYWDAFLFTKGELADKVIRPPQPLLIYLQKWNEKDGLPSVPSANSVTDRDILELKRILLKFPKPILDVMNSRLVGITLVSGLGSFGYSDYVYSTAGYPERGFIVLDRSLLYRSANEAFTERESSPFKCANGNSVIAKISRDAIDQEAAVQYILLHEFAHIFSEGYVNPFFYDAPDANNLASREYGPISWNVLDHKYVGKFDGVFSLRSKIKYYAPVDKLLGCEKFTIACSQVEKTDFPSLYASLSPFEDFAESFANFVHVDILKRPFEVSLYQEGKLSKQYRSCWASPRCAQKRAYFRNLLKNIDRFRNSR